MQRSHAQLIDEIRHRNVTRLARKQENKKRGLSGVAVERPRNKPGPLEDIETLLKILDQHVRR